MRLEHLDALCTIGLDPAHDIGQGNSCASQLAAGLMSGGADWEWPDLRQHEIAPPGARRFERGSVGVRSEAE